MQKKYINPDNLYHIPGFTQIVGVTGGTTYYLSGIVAFDKDLNTVGQGDLEAQLIQVFENLKIALESINATFDDVVKLTIYKVNYQPKDRETIIQIRDRYTTSKTPPANTLLGVQSLARPDILVEVEATVVLS